MLADPNNMGQHLLRGAIMHGLQDIPIIAGELEQDLKNEKYRTGEHGFGNLGQLFYSHMDGASRLHATQSCGSFNPHVAGPQSVLQALYKNSEVEQELRRIFWEVFGMDVRLDYSGLMTLSLRVAEQFEDIPEDPRAAFPVLQKYSALDEQGDGYRSFAGVVLSVLLSKGRIILLDEPEAFLHPAQARQLGHWLGLHAKTIESQVLVATHNASFLSGIVGSGAEVDIYRLNRSSNTTTFDRIAPEAISRLATSPLLSSQRVLEAIFFRGVIVCEGDADRAVYGTVASDVLARQDLLFMHAHDKQSIKPIVEMLKSAAIPVAAIVDADILNSHDELKAILQPFGIHERCENILSRRQRIAVAMRAKPENESLNELTVAVSQLMTQLASKDHTLSGARSALRRIERSGSEWEPLKRQGLAGVPLAVRAEANEITKELSALGLFIVPVGELESWMNLGTSQKSKWIVAALQKLHDGECPPQLKEFVSRIMAHFSGDNPGC